MFMRRYLVFSLALAAVIAYSASFALARGGHGGGHGGGHHGGGHHAHHGHHAHRHAHHGHHQHTNRHHHVAHHGGHHPFSHDWYNHHRGAWGWRNGGYGWGNPWAAANWGTAAAWLGLSALDGVGGVNDTTVYTGDANSEPDSTDGEPVDQTADADERGDDTFEPSATDSQELAGSGASVPTDANFLPLGVYSIAPAGQDEATALLHLAISKQGVLRGTYYDTKTDKDQPIQGAFDKSTGRVAWTVGDDSQDVYETSLKDLTEPSGPVTVHAPHGKSTEWTIAHYRGDDADAKAKGGARQPSEVKTGTQE
jgi:hypothetical protein